MYNVDIIIQHPYDVQYPLWMLEVNKNRDLFNQVIVSLTQNATGKNYKTFLETQGIQNPTITFGALNYRGIDWRDTAIHGQLNHVKSTHVLFLEQDFLATREFFIELLEKGQNYDSVGFVEGNRFHPACLLVKTDAINKTSKDFAAHPPEGDHFARFSQDLWALGNWTKFEDIGIQDNSWFHMAGLTQNYRMTSLFYQAPLFYTYNHLSMCIANQTEDWREFCLEKEKLMGVHEIDERIKAIYQHYFDAFPNLFTEGGLQ